MRITNTNPGEVRLLLAELDEHGVSLPCDGAHAAKVMTALDDESIYDHGLPDVADIDPERVSEVLRREALANEAETAMRNLGGQLRQSCANAIAQSLHDDLDEVLDQLRPAFDNAAAVVKAAHAAGLRGDHDAEAAIAVGGKAVEMWQKLPAACTVLDGIEHLRFRLSEVAEQPPKGDQRAGAFSAGAGLWNGYKGNRWLLLADHGGPVLNTAAETQQACFTPRKPTVAATVGLDVDQATLRAMLGRPVAR